MNRLLSWSMSLLFLWILPTVANAAGGPLGIDHEWTFDEQGIWANRYQKGLEVGVIAVEVGGAIWLGNENRLGHTLWQSVDSTVVAGLAAQVLKRAFGRARPDDGRGPNSWFQGRCCISFPSGEVTLQASFVTPIILDNHERHPWIWVLEALPLYDSIARMKSQDHWQTDVIAGWALGTAVGYWASHRQVPLSVQVLPHGLTVGMAKRF
jgi:membrane-associated phospholipid phosphatase